MNNKYQILICLVILKGNGIMDILECRGGEEI